MGEAFSRSRKRTHRSVSPPFREGLGVGNRGTMATISLEVRLTALEIEVAELKKRLASEKPQIAIPWWEQRFGAFAAARSTRRRRGLDASIVSRCARKGPCNPVLNARHSMPRILWLLALGSILDAVILSARAVPHERQHDLKHAREAPHHRKGLFTPRGDAVILAFINRRWHRKDLVHVQDGVLPDIPGSFFRHG